MENTQIGPFFIIKKLGSNRRHKVFHARQTEQDRDVALKFINIPRDIEMSVALHKIQVESEFLKKLAHPNLVQFYGAGIEDGKIFFASKLIKGEALSGIMSRRTRMSTHMSIDLARRVAKCLSYLHRQDLVHSKLTPDKILMDRRGIARVADLRLNRARKRRWDDQNKHQLEIAAYMAPEVLRGEGSTPKSDLYSLGVILFEMLTGKLPFEAGAMPALIKSKRQTVAPSVTEHAVNCPVWLEQLVQRMIQPNPDNRPASAELIVTQLKEIKAFDKHKMSVAAQGEEQEALLETVKQIRIDYPERTILGKVGTFFWDRKYPFVQSKIFLMACSLLLIAAMTFAMWPKSNEAILSEANKLAQSESKADLVLADRLYSQIIARNLDDPATGEARSKHDAIQRYLLVERAKKGGTTLEPDSTRSFIIAFNKEADGLYQEAIGVYESLVTDPQHIDRHVKLEAVSRLANLKVKVAEIERKASEINKLIADAREISKSDVTQAEKILRLIVEQYSSNRDYEPYVRIAQTELVRLNL